jgi:hypothetical protein
MSAPSRLLCLDLGQAQDYSAVAGLLREPTIDPSVSEKEFRRYTVTGLKRWELGTPYPQVVADVCRISEHEEARGQPLVIDATGVGRAVVDMFRQARREQKLHCHIVAVTITGVSAAGGGVMKSGPSPSGDWIAVKKDLVAVMQTVVQYDRLTIDPRLPLAAVLGKELKAFRVKVKLSTGNETFEAWREREHDDIVLAVALGVWYGERKRQAFVIW